MCIVSKEYLYTYSKKKNNSKQKKKLNMRNNPFYFLIPLASYGTFFAARRHTIIIINDLFIMLCIDDCAQYRAL